MLNFIKYNWLRRWKFFLSGTIVFLLVNLDLFSRLTNKLSPNIISVVLIVLLFGLGAAFVLDHMGRLYRTLFSEEGVSELTLPLSGYQLLGAKLIAVILECVAVMIIVGFVAYIDLKYVETIVPKVQLTLASLTGEHFLELLQIVGLMLAGYITFILMVYLSLALAKSLFASFKYGKLIAFLCFLVIGKLIEYTGNLMQIHSSYGVYGTNIVVAAADWLIIIVLIGILFTATAYLLDRKINL